MYYVIKVAVSAALIVIVSEIAKRNHILGGIFASVPLISFIAIIWIFFETKDIENIRTLSKSVFWLVLPSLSFFALFPVLLKHELNFWLSFLISSAVMILLYYITVSLLKLFHF